MRFFVKSPLLLIIPENLIRQNPVQKRRASVLFMPAPGQNFGEMGGLGSDCLG